MTQTLKHWLLIATGWLLVIIGIIGMFLPLLPTTVFMIGALYCFSKSSERFHQMLLHNRWVGPSLQQWEQDKSVTRQTKIKACSVIAITFSISIAVLIGRPWLQLMLVVLGTAVFTYMWRLKEREASSQFDSIEENGHA